MSFPFRPVINFEFCESYKSLVSISSSIHTAVSFSFILEMFVKIYIKINFLIIQELKGSLYVTSGTLIVKCKNFTMVIYYDTSL
jgi:hypothetical protein